MFFKNKCIPCFVTYGKSTIEVTNITAYSYIIPNVGVSHDFSHEHQVPRDRTHTLYNKSNFNMASNITDDNNNDCYLLSKIEFYRVQNKVPKPLPKPLDTSKLKNVPQQ